MRIRASLVCVESGKILLVLLRDPLTKVARWFPPGGMIEANETPAQTAQRETLEETGFRVKVDLSASLTADYKFTWNGDAYEVKTHFFRGRLAEPFREPVPVADASYLIDCAWKPIKELPELLGFDRVILESCLALIEDARHG